jgi:3,4-dihydroxy 2-butanone 4-phosphate synthase/GTP cyclohydrolase II
MRQIEQAGRGAVVYLRGGGDATSAYLHERLQAHRGTGHIAKGSDTPDLADQSHAAMASQGLPKHMRDLGIGCQILRDLGIRKMNLLTNQLTDMPNLDAFGLEVAGRTGLRV